MNKPMYEFVIAQLAAYRGRWPSVAKGSGVSKRTLEKIASGETDDPGVKKVQKLHDYFISQAKGK